MSTYHPDILTEDNGDELYVEDIPATLKRWYCRVCKRVLMRPREITDNNQAFHASCNEPMVKVTVLVMPRS